MTHHRPSLPRGTDRESPGKWICCPSNSPEGAIRASTHSPSTGAIRSDCVMALGSLGWAMNTSWTAGQLMWLPLKISMEPQNSGLRICSKRFLHSVLSASRFSLTLQKGACPLLWRPQAFQSITGNSLWVLSAACLLTRCPTNWL